MNMQLTMTPVSGCNKESCAIATGGAGFMHLQAGVANPVTTAHLRLY
jgi:hypothetical protein